MAFLTDKTLASGVTLNDFIHIVIPTDISQNPAGSSYKATIEQVLSGFTGTTIYEVGSGNTSTQRVGTGSEAIGDNSVVSGGITNTTYGISSFIGAGTSNTIVNGGSVIGGGSCNTVLDNLSSILGGRRNTTDLEYASISGGFRNKSIGPWTHIGGGCSNTIFGEYSIIGGGGYNTVNSCFSSILGGGGKFPSFGNMITSNNSTILGGSNNTLLHDYSSAVGLNIVSQSACTLHTNYLSLYTVPDYDNTNTNMLVRDPSNGVIKQRNISNAINKNYGSFYDTGDQTGLAGNILTMSANTSDSWNNGIILSADTRFVIQTPGVYNLSFSAQIVKINGNSATHGHIWLSQNGSDVTYSASQIGFPSNSVYSIAAWNFLFETITQNEYVELKWEIDSNVDNGLILTHEPASGNVPGIPSLIVTINQVN